MATLKEFSDSCIALYGQLTEAEYRLVPTAFSAPGQGKTTAIKALAPKICDTYNIDPDDFEFVELRPAECDPTEIMGIPWINKDGEVSVEKPHWFPTKQHGILYVTELGQCTTAVLNVLSALFRELKAGTHALPQGFMVVADTNRKKDKAGIMARIPNHIQDRMLQFHIEPDAKGQRDYAVEHDWADVIVFYLNYRPENLVKINDDGFGATPRKWEFVSDVLKKGHDPDVERSLVYGVLGEEVASDFLAFSTVFELLPDLNELIANPTGASTNYEPNVLYALIGALSTAMAKDYNKAEAVIQYLNRLDQEWAFACIADAQRFNVQYLKEKKECKGELTKSRAFTDWLVSNKDVFV